MQLLVPVLALLLQPNDYTSNAGASAALGGFLIAYFIFLAIALVLAIWFWWKIFTKAGYSGALSLLQLLGPVFLIVFIWFAFAEWPALRGGTRT